ncbi:MAG: Amuc_1100 family pilus-like protein, partial [Chthoniobacterales bacterium]
SFLAALGVATLVLGFFLLHEKGAANEAQARLQSTIDELTRLRRSSPFPKAGNLQKTKAQADTYRSSLFALEQELKTRMFPRPPLLPNEFQAQLRAAVNDVEERARAGKVRLPAPFNLGFDEYATSLPNGLAAPRLGRQLRAIQWIVNTMIEAHIDSLNGLTRPPLLEEKGTDAPTPTPGRAGAVKPPAAAAEETGKLVDATSVDVAFTASSAAARRIVNQITAAKEQFYVVRTLRVKNQEDKGPKRGGAAEAPAAAAPPGATGKAAEPGITFIVGTEHVDVALKIEIMKFIVPRSGGSLGE